MGVVAAFGDTRQAGDDDRCEGAARGGEDVGVEPLVAIDMGEVGVVAGTVARLGVRRRVGYFRVRSLTEGGCVAWMLRLVKIGVEGEGPCTDIMEIRKPDDLVDIANLGLTLAEAKLLLAGVQREIVVEQAVTSHQKACRAEMLARRKAVLDPA